MDWKNKEEEDKRGGCEEVEVEVGAEGTRQGRPKPKSLVI